MHTTQHTQKMVRQFLIKVIYDLVILINVFMDSTM